MGDTMPSSFQMIRVSRCLCSERKALQRCGSSGECGVFVVSRAPNRSTSRLARALLVPFVVVAAFLSPAPVSAETPCHLISPGNAVPEGFGAPYDVASSSEGLLVRATCTASSARIEVGTGNKLQYIYEQGYEWYNNQWNSIEYDGSNKTGQWIIDMVTAVLDSADIEMLDDNHFVTYVCTWTSGQWKCGCRDTTCTESCWQLQAFHVPSPTAPDEPPPPVTDDPL